MQDQDKVTVIVAIYKSEKFIRKCIESIINQTYKNLEIILVDDGSPDNCPSICDEYQKQDTRIIVIHKENGGACEARNVGLSRATGEYVSIIDGDDWLEPDYVEYLLNIIHTTNSTMAMTDHIFTTRDRKQVESDEIMTWTNEQAAAAIIYPIIAIGPWNKLYKLSMIKENNIDFSVPWSGEGLYFSCMAAQYSNHVGVGHRKVYNYRLNNAGSGLTNYKLEMGTNALSNIFHIWDVSVIRTKRFENAVKWHIWKNYGFVMFLIIATDSKKENIELYKSCRREMRKRLPETLLKCEIGSAGKIKMIIRTLFPEFTAKYELRRARKALSKDLFE